MLLQAHYLLRSKADGSYLVANLDNQESPVKNSQYLLIFNESFDALSYLNTHGFDIREKFVVESIAFSIIIISRKNAFIIPHIKLT